MWKRLGFISIGVVSGFVCTFMMLRRKHSTGVEVADGLIISHFADVEPVDYSVSCTLLPGESGWMWYRMN